MYSQINKVDQGDETYFDDKGWWCVALLHNHNVGPFFAFLGTLFGPLFLWPRQLSNPGWSKTSVHESMNEFLWAAHNYSIVVA